MITFSSTTKLLIRPMNSAPSACSRFGLGRRVGAFHCGPVVVPELGDAIDLDIGRGNVGTRPFFDNVRLHIAPHPRHRMGQRCVHLEPMLDEVFVREPFLAGQQSYALDHLGLALSLLAVLAHAAADNAQEEA